MESVYKLKERHDQLLEPKMLMDMYTGKDAPFLTDTVMRVIPLLNKAFASGGVKGDRLIALCFGPFFNWAFPACENLKDIIICCPNDKCINELEKWRTNAPGAIDWSHAVKAHCEVQGKGESWIEKQSMWQKKIKQPVKYDVSKSNPLSPTLLPQADCLLLSHCLEAHVTDKETFITAMKNVTTLLKPGGNLVIIACLEESYYMVGNYKFPHLCIDEDFVRKALCDTGYDIVELHVSSRTVNQLYDVADYTAFIIVNARKR
ncbi:nicotinamide N-methyltransferase-like [Lissotriton helveticus]